ncbi:MAG: hypothetical protein ACYCW6_10295 [Candidatus Xenobia bacterium]
MLADRLTDDWVEDFLGPIEVQELALVVREYDSAILEVLHEHLRIVWQRLRQIVFPAPS